MTQGQTLKEACIAAGAVEISDAEYARRRGETTLTFVVGRAERATSQRSRASVINKPADRQVR